MAISATDAMRKFVASGLKTSRPKSAGSDWKLAALETPPPPASAAACAVIHQRKVKILSEVCPLGQMAGVGAGLTHRDFSSALHII